ncbi:MAG TPA: hypothetical protein DEH11_05520 [Actinobacteria bacterium]|nr:hypothetical protein [Actinomycetota bacterium]
MTGVSAVPGEEKAAAPSPATDPKAAAPRETPAGRPRSAGGLIARWLVVLVPALVELVAGGYKISQPSLWRDEGYTREVVQWPIGKILTMARHEDAVHAFYYVVMHPVVAAFGVSATTLRMPSLIASCAAAGLTAALGARLARAGGLRAPLLTGLMAGLLFAALPLTTWYAQDARPYSMATLCAVGATYLFVRAIEKHSGRLWVGYAVVIFILALLNLFALLLVVAHGVSLLIMRARARRMSEDPRFAEPHVPLEEGELRPPHRLVATMLDATRSWWTSVIVAGIVLLPFIVIGMSQSGQISWLTRPGVTTVKNIIYDFAGTRDLVILVAALAVVTCVADLFRRASALINVGVIALPWLALPPVVLVVLSEVKPIYDERYIIFCMPAISLLVAAGLCYVGGYAAQRLGGQDVLRSRVVATVPVVILLAVTALLLVHPQRTIRTTAARPDDLRGVAAVLAANERPGDAVLYLPWGTRSVALGYPGPFQKLQDIGQRQSAYASATLRGMEASGKLLSTRDQHLSRMWVVTLTGQAIPDHTKLSHVEFALIGRMHLIHRWKVKSVTLSLYTPAAS